MGEWIQEPVIIDPELHALCPPLNDEEYQQLEANLRADGCRDALVVWQETGILLDGHNRHDICQAHDLLFLVEPISLDDREAAINWIINNQLGRRNVTEEQKSYLRGKRYNREKSKRGAPRQNQNAAKQIDENQLFESRQTAARLAEEYHISEDTIKRDGHFASAIDTLESQVRDDIRETVLKRKERGKQQPTKTQVTRAGKLIEEEKVKPLPFMQRPGWKPYQVLQAIEILGIMPQEEHTILNSFLDRPFLPADQGLKILHNLKKHQPTQRQHIYTLATSADPREQSLALTLAAEKVPEPDPQVMLAGNLIRAVEEVRERQRRNWRLPYAAEPWTPTLEDIDHTLVTVQDRWREIAREVEASHHERIANHAKVFDPSR